MPLKVHHLLLDVNGTLSVDGQLIPGIKERIETLQEKLIIYLLTLVPHVPPRGSEFKQ